MQSESESGAGALVPRTAAPAITELSQTSMGGVGLFDHTAQDAVSPSAGRWAGATALLLTLAVGVALVSLNPAYQDGKAGGTPNQLGEAAVGAAAPEIAPGSPAAEGQQLIATKPCVGCHTIPGVPGANGTIGPSLAGLASRTRIAGGAVPSTGPDDLKAWILDPGKLKPGTAMPNVGLTDDEATRIVAYLEVLK